MLSEVCMNKLRGLVIAASLLILSSNVWASHSEMLGTLPTDYIDYREEALNWCGPATGTIIMAGYPSGSCSVLQEDVWGAIGSNKVEAMWDTDPVGLEKAMEALCPPAYGWVIKHKTDPTELMYSVARLMTQYKYPVAALLSTTAHHPTLPTHTEHWVSIWGVVTDVDPTANPSVTLEWILYHDPSPVDLGDSAILSYISGGAWYAIFQPVTKAGSGYHGEYVAIAEPPPLRGVAIAPEIVMMGRLITPEDALRAAAQWIAEHKLYEMEPYKILKKAKPLRPLLVNKRYGGYFIIPYASEGNGPEAGSQRAQVAVIINAYTGDPQQVGVFEPVEYVQRQEAIDMALEYLKVEEPGEVDAELISPPGAGSRYFPMWKVTVDRRVLGVDRHRKIYTKLPSEDPAIPLPGKRPQGITWDGEQLWVVDGEAKKLYRIDSRSGAVLRSVDIDAENPEGLAFDGERIWIADEGGKKIYALDPESGQLVKTIEMQIPQEKGYKSFEGITWDGTYLWTAFFAGFSSSFNQIDTENGKIIKSVFADCHPRGIASDGKYLWSICYNGENFPPKIDRREILEEGRDMIRSRVFVKDIAGREPVGLVYDGQFLWYADGRLKQVFKYYAGELEER
jgi:hypothetical protein